MSSMVPRKQREDRGRRESLKDFSVSERAAIEAVRSWYPGDVVVFGSRSKGTYADDSDLDLGVEGVPNRRHMKSVLEDLQVRYGMKIDLRPKVQVEVRSDAVVV